MTIDDEQTPYSFSTEGRDAVRRRAAEEPDPQAQRKLPENRPGLTYAPPSNCVLHYLAPKHEVRPSFATVIGLSLCADCMLRASDHIVGDGTSAKEFMSMAIDGTWL